MFYISHIRSTQNYPLNAFLGSFVQKRRKKKRKWKTLDPTHRNRSQLLLLLSLDLSNPTHIRTKRSEGKKIHSGNPSSLMSSNHISAEGVQEELVELRARGGEEDRLGGGELLPLREPRAAGPSGKERNSIVVSSSGRRSRGGEGRGR